MNKCLIIYKEPPFLKLFKIKTLFRKSFIQLTTIVKWTDLFQYFQAEGQNLPAKTLTPNCQS